MSNQPLLGHHEDGHTGGPKATGLLLFSNLFRGGLFAPNWISYDAICILLNADSEEEKDKYTELWRGHKLEELNFVGTVGALIATCMCTTGSWPTVMSNGKDQPWYIRVCWYTGIVLALFAVVTAAQQSLRLHRLSSHRDGLHFIRKSMTYRRGPDGLQPAMLQIYAWQMSMVFLTTSVMVLIMGILLLVWTGATWGPEKRPEDGWWDDSSRMAITLTVIVVSCLVCFILAQPALAERAEEDIKRSRRGVS